MKKLALLLLSIFVLSCQSEKKEENHIEDIISNDTIQSSTAQGKSPDVEKHSNEIFKEVIVESLGENKYKASGSARVFEATLNWSVEDGHFVLAEGYVTANMGAPEWGDFEFEFTAKKVDDHSTLILILYEASAKDGSHRHELPIKLQ